MTPLLEITNLCKTYPHQDAPVLAGVDLKIDANETLAIVGPSGCGKSTLLNLIAALDSPTDGTIQLAGHDLACLDETARTAVRANTVGMIFQDHHLLPQLSVWENLLLPGLAGDADDLPETASQLLDAVGLAEKRTALPGELSGGQRQRVAVARALVRKPALVLADEPTGSLDRRTAETVADLLLNLATDRQAAVLIVTHDESLAARTGRVLHLRDGRLQETATSDSANT